MILVCYFDIFAQNSSATREPSWACVVPHRRGINIPSATVPRAGIRNIDSVFPAVRIQATD